MSQQRKERGQADKSMCYRWRNLISSQTSNIKMLHCLSGKTIDLSSLGQPTLSTNASSQHYLLTIRAKHQSNSSLLKTYLTPSSLEYWAKNIDMTTIAKSSTKAFALIFKTTKSTWKLTILIWTAYAIS